MAKKKSKSSKRKNRLKSNLAKKRASGRQKTVDYHALEPRRMLSCTPNTADPNDEICETNLTLLNGQTHTGLVDPITDVDLYAISITSSLLGQDVTFNLNETDGSFDTYLRLFDDAGTELDDDEDGGPGNNSQIDFTFTATGTYYLGVSTSGNQNYDPNDGTGLDTDRFSSTGSYAITFQDTNDQIDEASMTLLDGMSSGTINLSTDVDLFRWNGIDGQSIRFEVDGDAVSGGSGLDTYLRIFDDSGNQLDFDDDGGTGFRDSELTFTFPNTGEFYVGVSSVDNETYDVVTGTGDSGNGNTGSYDLTATEVSIDPNDRISNAVSLDLADRFVDDGESDSFAPDGSETGTIDSPIDVDLFKFTVVNRSFIHIDVDRSNGLDTYLRLFNAAGTQIAANDDANAPGEIGLIPRDSYLGLFLDAGTYYAGVSGFGNNNYDIVTGLEDTAGDTGSYAINIRDGLIVSTTSDTSNSDDGFTSLRDAIELVNEEASSQTATLGIHFSDHLFGANSQTITLVDQDQLEIEASVTINGPRADLLSISGNDDTRVIEINDDSSIHRDVTISGVTIRDGNTSAASAIRPSKPGAGIFNAENLTLKDVSIISNRSERTVLPESPGGGLFHQDGMLTISESLFSENIALEGGGIFIDSGNAEISNSTFTGNAALSNGGGLHAETSGTTVVRNSTVTGNRANNIFGVITGAGGGGIATFTLSTTLHNTIVAGNFRGLGANEVIDDTVNPFTSASSHNLIGESDSGSSLNNGVNGNIVGDGNGGAIPIASILNTTLAANGGTTLSHELVSGSPAINAGDPSATAGIGSTPLLDQRGQPRVQAGRLDIGAVESNKEPNSLVVTTVDDIDDDTDGETSLREAIDFANDNGIANDTITFDSSLANDTINTTSELVITNSVLIEGSDSVTIRGNGSHRIFNVDDGDDAVHHDVLIRGLTITNGNASQSQSPDGGGIVSREALTLDRVHLLSNTAGRNGGGVSQQKGELHALNSTISDNVASGSVGGGEGGGVQARDGGLISNSTISGNSARLYGGGIYSDSSMVVRNSTITGNRFLSASNGSGGGVSGPQLHNSIVAGNLGASGISYIPNDARNVHSSSSYNLIGNAATAGGLTDGANGNVVGFAGAGTINTSTVLNTTLADNGGATLTHALAPSSPAINAGDPDATAGVGTTPLLDQRGQSRVQVGRLDIGAVESEVEASSLVVTIADDSDDDTDGETSLREAIDFANGNGNGNDTITFAPNVFNVQTKIDISSQLPTITDALTITGPGANLLTIDAQGGGDNVLDGNGFRIFEIDDNSSSLIDVSLSGLTLTGGDNGVSGGAINNLENLTLDRVAIDGNRSRFGGGISNDRSGVLTITNSTIANNVSSQNGGGISNGGALTATNATISGNSAVNSGGAIISAGGPLGATLAVNSSTITGNTGDQSVSLFSSYGPTTATFNNTIINNANSITGVGSNGTTLSGNNNLFAGANPNIVGADNLFNATPNLASLADNGGATLTHALAPSSPAINAGDPNATPGVGATPLLDQRGQSRVQVGRLDIGAVESEVEASSLVVTIAGDIDDDTDGETSLREAIDFANDITAGPNGNGDVNGDGLDNDTITFDSSLQSGEITLDSSQGELTITQSLTIDGLQNTLNANGQSRVMNFTGTSGDLTLNDLAIVNGAASDEGAGIRFGSTGDLTLNRSTVSGNAVQGSGTSMRGGGIFSEGSITLNNSSIHQNSLVSTGSEAKGGGLYAGNGLAVNNSTLFGNSVEATSNGAGGAAYVYSSGPEQASITNSTITGNSASFKGGGLYTGARTTTVSNSILLGNTAVTVPHLSEFDVFTAEVTFLGNNIVGDSEATFKIAGRGFSNVEHAAMNDVFDDSPEDIQGFTPTIELLALSTNPALDAGDDSLVVGLTDGRGENRIADLNGITNDTGAVDLGAYEVQSDQEEERGLVVTTSVDTVDPFDFQTSLREAIDFANDNGIANDTITFDSSLANQTITTGSELLIASSLTIDGIAANSLILSGANGSHRVFNVDDGSGSLSDVFINDLTIADGGDGIADRDGAGIRSVENLTLSRVSLVNNHASLDQGLGGGVRHSIGVLVVRDSTLSGNSARYGGGIYTNSNPSVSILNSTLSGNEASQYGAGLSTNADTTIVNSTFTGNRSDSDGNGGAGGGINAFPGLVTMHNTIVAGNFRGDSASQTPNDINANTLVLTSSNNLIGNAASAGGLTDGNSGNIVGVAGVGTININSVLDSNLADNGGPTRAHAIVGGSQAIDAGDNALANDENGVALATDQRGESRLFDGNNSEIATVDIGAFEKQAVTIAGQHIFYNNSSFDGTDPSDVNDAIATDKVVLRHGETATFENYTSYVNGINGLIIDLPQAGDLIDGDFQLKFGNEDNTDNWATINSGATIISRTMIDGGGLNGSDRVILEFADGTFTNGWLQVKVTANEFTGLTADEIFYFGNVIGETGNDAANATTNIADVSLTRLNQTGFGTTDALNVYDFDRNRRVNLADVAIARQNQSGFSPVNLITPTSGSGRGAGGDKGKSGGAIDGVDQGLKHGFAKSNAIGARDINSDSASMLSMERLVGGSNGSLALKANSVGASNPVGGLEQLESELASPSSLMWSLGLIDSSMDSGFSVQAEGLLQTESGTVDNADRQSVLELVGSYAGEETKASLTDAAFERMESNEEETEVGLLDHDVLFSTEFSFEF